MVDLRRDGDVFVLSLGDTENRFNPTSIGALHACLDEVEGSEGPAALVTTGVGKFFSNGLDLDWMAGQDTPATSALLVDVHRAFGRILALPMATVAAVNGHAFAAGAMLSVAHDHRVMRTDRGYWCLNEVDLGLPLSPGMLALLTARLPAMTAHRAIVTGHRFPAPEAAEAGIVDDVADESEVLGSAVATAAALAHKRADIMATLKAGLHGDCIALLLAGGQRTEAP